MPDSWLFILWFRRRRWDSRCDFSLFLRSNSDFKHSSNAETSQKAKEIKRLLDCGVYTVRFAQKSKNTFPSWRAQFISDFGHNHRMRRFIAINGPDHVSFGELTRLSRVRLIWNGALRCRHVARRREGVASIHPSDLHRTITISQEVHWARLIVTVYNSFDGSPRLNFI